MPGLDEVADSNSDSRGASSRSVLWLCRELGPGVLYAGVILGSCVECVGVSSPVIHCVHLVSQTFSPLFVWSCVAEWKGRSVSPPNVFLCCPSGASCWRSHCVAFKFRRIRSRFAAFFLFLRCSWALRCCAVAARCHTIDDCFGFSFSLWV